MHHVKAVSQNIVNSCSPKRCILRGKFKSQSSVNKAWIVSVCSSHCCSSFSFPFSSLLLPLPLLFQLLFHFPLILLIPLSSTRVQIPIPLGWGAAFLQFDWTFELKRPLHCLPPVVLLPLGYFTHVWSVPFQRIQHFPALEGTGMPTSAEYLPVGLTPCWQLSCTGRLSRRLSHS